ncbi:hypothetical protein C1I98_24070 [Spongiactinospora gelatinilytica]|uniref:DDE Tnp4 domain-containing protein n=1 Tax=Spongiactinospora gelatinilytica TaxID=2666298 RepID=A0A2W2FT12_9ACTN|nr:hypothetical protein C1I98_24070 [Spongiactinospora gelatinilytica]
MDLRLPAGLGARPAGGAHLGHHPPSTVAGLVTLADKAYIGAGRRVLVPYKGRKKPQSQKTANSAHAKLRGPGERANAVLNAWRILRKLRCCPLLTGQLVKAILVLQPRSAVKKSSLQLRGTR